MRLTSVLYRTSMERQIKRHWFIERKKKIPRTRAEANLRARGVEVLDAVEYVFPKRPDINIELTGLHEQVLPMDSNHPLYQETPCCIFKDEDLLVEGYKQARLLTNTVEISKYLPNFLLEKEGSMELFDHFIEESRRKVYLSCLTDAMQEKLPIVKDPARPAWNFVRGIGLTDVRKNTLLCKNLVGICRLFQSLDHHSQVSNAFFSAPLQAFGKIIQFELTAELLLTSSQPLKPIRGAEETEELILGNMFPLDCTVSLKNYHFYNIQNFFPLPKASKWPYIHTAFLHFNPTKTKNLYDSPVTNDQIIGRSVVKGFAMAAAQAHSMYGAHVKELPEPIVVQLIHTDSKWFHFSVFQLNTLDIDQHSAIKNMYWTSEVIPLYDSCEYVSGTPTLGNFNTEVIKRVIAFCHNK